jgi:short-subunit dehydrogenase
VTGVSDAIGVALARAQAAPGVRLCLVGEAAETLDRTGEDCRQRGALVETFCVDGKSPSALADYLEDLDSDAPVDALLVHGGAAGEPLDSRLVERDISRAMRLVIALGEKMRRRESGDIVLVSPLAGRVATGDPRAALSIAQAFVTYGVDLRRRMGASGVSVAVVAPSRLAIRAAFRLREPSLAMVGADRLAEQIERGMRRRRAAIAVLGSATLAWRVLSLVPSRVHEALRDTLLPGAEAIGEPEDEAAIAEKSVTGGAAD